MSSILQKQVTYTSAGSAPGAAQVQVAYSGRVQVTLPTVRAIIKGWVNTVAATGTTMFQLRIYRGNGLAGTVIGNASAVTVTAGNYFDIWVEASEQLLNMEFVDYTLGFTAVGASGGTSFNGAMLEVELING
jgi:hypothetical protein